jgi:hypothetical protein
MPVPWRSSILEEVSGQSLSGGAGARVWPFSLDFGIPVNCEW